MWTYLEEDGHLRRYAHDSCSSTQGCHIGRKKRRIKEGPTTRRREGFSAIWSFTTTERLISHDLSPRLELSAFRSFSTDRLLTDFPGPATWDLLLPPWPAPSRCPRPASLLLPFGLGPSEYRATGLLPDPGGDYPRFTQFLPRSIFSIARLPFPITPILNSVRPPLSPSPLLTFVINWSDQHLNRCFLISGRAYIFQRTTSTSYKLERDTWKTKITHLLFENPPFNRKSCIFYSKPPFNLIKMQFLFGNLPFSPKIIHFPSKITPFHPKITHFLFQNPPLNPKITHFLLENHPFNLKITHFLFKHPSFHPQIKRFRYKNPPFNLKITHFLNKKLTCKPKSHIFSLKIHHLTRKSCIFSWKSPL